MLRRPPRSTRTDTPFPYTTLFRSPAPVAALPMARSSRVSADNPMRAVSARVSAPTLVPEPEARELLYETVDWIPPAGQLGTSIYEPYALQSLRIEGASAHQIGRAQGLTTVTNAHIVCRLLLKK